MEIIDAFFVEFGWMLVAAVIAGIISIKVRLPPIIGLIFFGMLIGPNVLGLAGSQSINLLADIGAVLLLFMIGIEFSITKLLLTGLRAILAGFFLITLTFVFIYEIAILAGFDFLTSMYIGAMLSLSSTTIIIKILEQRGLIMRMEVPFLIAILIVEDIIAIFLLTFFSSLKTTGLTNENIFVSVVLSLAILLFTYLILKNIIKKFSDVFLRYQAEDTLVFFSFILGIGMSLIAKGLGLTPSIGAFLAGSIIAALPNGKEFKNAIKPFSLVFSSFFFLSIGMLIDPATLSQNATITLLLIGAFVICVSTLAGFIIYMISSNGKSAVLASLTMIPLGEFSLLIAKESMGSVSINLVEIAAIGALITSLLSSLMVKKFEDIHAFLNKHTPNRVIRRLRAFSKYYNTVIAAFEPGGYFYKLAVKQAKEIIKDVVYVIGAFLLIITISRLFKFDIIVIGFEINFSMLIIIAILLFLIYPIYRIVIAIKKMIDALVTVVLRITSRITAWQILKNGLISVIMILIAVNTPVIVKILKLPGMFNFISIPIALIALFFVWSVLRATPAHTKNLWGKHINIFKRQIIIEPDDMIIQSIAKKTGKPKKGRKSTI